jgi:hypothetical protein
MTATLTATAHRSTGRRAHGTYRTREEWIWAALDRAILPWLAEVDADPDTDRLLISVGFAPGQHAGGSTRGVCYHNSISGGKNTVFVMPETDDLIQTLATLLHETLHAADDHRHTGDWSGHKGWFATKAAELGYLPSFTDSGNRTPELQAMLERLAADLGPFGGHIKFDLTTGRTVTVGSPLRPGGHAGTVPMTMHRPRQQNRHYKATCATDGCAAAADGYAVRMSRSQAEAHGAPICPSCEQQMTFEGGGN